jgi:hypothetical protein
MSEDLIDSVAPLLAPPVTRHPTGISGSDDEGADVCVLVFAVVMAFADGDDGDE